MACSYGCGMQDVCLNQPCALQHLEATCGVCMYVHLLRSHATSGSMCGRFRSKAGTGGYCSFWKIFLQRSGESGALDTGTLHKTRRVKHVAVLVAGHFVAPKKCLVVPQDGSFLCLTGLSLLCLIHTQGQTRQTALRATRQCSISACHEKCGSL